MLNLNDCISKKTVLKNPSNSLERLFLARFGEQIWCQDLDESGDCFAWHPDEYRGWTIKAQNS